MNFGLTPSEETRLQSIEAYFEVVPVPNVMTDRYLACAAILYEFRQKEKIEFYYEALFLAGALVAKIPDVRVLAETCLYYS